MLEFVWNDIVTGILAKKPVDNHQVRLEIPQPPVATGGTRRKTGFFICADLLSVYRSSRILSNEIRKGTNAKKEERKRTGKIMQESHENYFPRVLFHIIMSSVSVLYRYNL